MLSNVHFRMEFIYFLKLHFTPWCKTTFYTKPHLDQVGNLAYNGYNGIDFSIQILGLSGGGINTD